MIAEDSLNVKKIKGLFTEDIRNFEDKYISNFLYCPYPGPTLNRLMGATPDLRTPHP